MPRKSKAFLRRSEAAKRGWQTRRRNERARRRQEDYGEDYVDVIGIDSIYEE